jgi:hypothetical protein
MHPVWLEGAGTRAVAPNSIDKSHVRVDKGTMSFDKVFFTILVKLFFICMVIPFLLITQ